MKFFKKSLGQNFLIDQNIIKKITSLVDIENKNVLEIGPGSGALTAEILKKNPRSLIVIEKDKNLAIKLKSKFKNKINFRLYNEDILRIDLKKIVRKNLIVFGNLPYNISSQILVKFLKIKKSPPDFCDLIFMFQKELGDKIVAKFPSSDYGRLSILSTLKLEILKKFLVSRNCFFPKPKVTSIVIHFRPKENITFKIKDINNLEKVTNILFSNKRKMINKNIKKILSQNKINQINGLDLKLRPSSIKPEIYYKITELFEIK